MNWWRRLRARLSGDNVSLPKARSRFEAERAGLEQTFFTAVSTSGKPRGLRWKSIEWEPGNVLAREKQTGRLAALVGVSISFEAVEGSDMEDLPAVGMLRNATAVFFYSQNAWRTTGKVIFNLNPDEAISHFKEQYELV